MTRKAIICDLDGTLCINAHRQHFLEKTPRDWDGFFEACDGDEKRGCVARFLEDYPRQYVRIFVTGRPLKVRDKTLRWLRHNVYLPQYIVHMRPSDDFRPDDVVKREIYDFQIAPKYDVEVVLDDRDKVVAMWRSLGLNCWQVAPGDF